MSFGDNLKLIRKERNITQEALADILNVTRQAISKWESGIGYPETEKLLLLSKELNVSLDYLLLDEKKLEEEKNKVDVKAALIPSGKISIRTNDGTNIVECHAVKSSPIAFPGKNEPKYVLNGVDKVTFLGEHTIILGWYASLDDIKREIEEISIAIEKCELMYTLKYAAEVEFVGIFGTPKLCRD